MGKRKATFLMIAVVAVIMVIAVLLMNRTNIFQEGNPIPVLKGISTLTVGNEPYAKIKEEPPTYITKTGNHTELFTLIENAYGVKYREQPGSGYHFEGENAKVLVTVRQYSKIYQIWEISQTD